MSKQEKLIKIIESFRNKYHYHVEEDNWYSCPAHPEYSGDDAHVCSCGLLEHNLKVDEALQIARGLTKRAVDLPNKSRQPSWADDGLDDAVIGSLP